VLDGSGWAGVGAGVFLASWCRVVRGGTDLPLLSRKKKSNNNNLHGITTSGVRIGCEELSVRVAFFIIFI